MTSSINVEYTIRFTFIMSVLAKGHLCFSATHSAKGKPFGHINQKGRTNLSAMLNRYVLVEETLLRMSTYNTVTCL